MISCLFCDTKLPKFPQCLINQLFISLPQVFHRIHTVESDEDEKVINKIQLYLPRFFALIPFLVVNLGFLSYHPQFSIFDIQILNFNPVCTLLYIGLRRKFIRSMNHGIEFSDSKIKNIFLQALSIYQKFLKSIAWIICRLTNSTYEFKVSFSKYDEKMMIADLGINEKAELFLPLILLSFSCLVLHLMSFWPPINLIEPITVIVWALGVWTGVFIWFMWLESQLNIKLGLGILLWLFICSYFNDNHKIKTISPSKDQDTLLTFKRFPSLDSKINDFKPWQKDSTIYLVAGQGSGIRAAYWTYLVLDQLEKDIPNFKNKLMGTSTVSGSSLGSACFWLRKINKNETKEVLHPFWSNSDLLTPVIGYFLFNDMVQRFLPFPIDSWDRGKAFEAGVEMEWDKYQKEFIGLMSKGFIQNAQHLTPIFFNSTHVETGQKCIISNVNLEQSPYNQYFEIAKKDIPWSAALSLSARFPMITPAGTVYENDNHIWGHINDGGYHENSGIETIRFIYQKIKKSPPELKVKVIYLKNGQDASHNRSSKGLHELKSVTGSFYNSWSILPDNLIEAFAFDLQAQNDTLITIALPRSSDDQLPLGWFLSSKSIQIIQNELKELVASDAWKQFK